MRGQRIICTAALFAFALAGCGGNATTLSPLPHPVTTSVPVARAVTTTFRLHIGPKSATKALRRSIASRKHPAFVDANFTQSVGVVVDTQPMQSVTLASPNAACTPDGLGGENCSFSIGVNNPIATGNGNAFTITTYDGPNATGNTLSTTTLMQRIVIGQANTITTTLTGIATTIVASVDVANSSGTIIHMPASDGDDYVVAPLTQGATPTITFNVTQLDADGATILRDASGAGIAPVSVALASHLSIAQNLSQMNGAANGTLVNGEFTLSGTANTPGAVAVTLTATNPSGSTPAQAQATVNVYMEGDLPPFTTPDFVNQQFTTNVGIITPPGTFNLALQLLSNNNVPYIGPYTLSNPGSLNFVGFICAVQQPQPILTVGDTNGRIFEPHDTLNVLADTVDMSDQCELTLTEAFESLPLDIDLI